MMLHLMIVFRPNASEAFAAPEVIDCHMKAFVPDCVNILTHVLTHYLWNYTHAYKQIRDGGGKSAPTPRVE